MAVREALKEQRFGSRNNNDVKENVDEFKDDQPLVDAELDNDNDLFLFKRMQRLVVTEYK